ncbi:MAG: amidophosphoribosyltransferase [Chitinophagales bacterium]|nr:amidophosphoribosyltransferase [Chitinophagales bacterium]
MSDSIQHECGVALIRLLKPLSYYKEKYNDVHYGLTKMYLLMEKQHNRGQDGVGLATIKLDAEPGSRYYDRIRSVDNQGIKKIFEGIFSQFSYLSDDEKKVLDDMEKVKAAFPYMGELLLGHLRYGTTEGKGILSCHPRIRPNNWMTRTLMIAGNFGLTNVGELFDNLIQLGQFPREKSGTTTILEKVGHFLDVENQRLFDKYKAEGLNNAQITKKIAQHLDVQNILRESVKDFDGGYVMAGLIGHGDAFVLRDPNGIRPAFYYQDDEIVVVASERPAIQTVMDVSIRDVKEVEPGTALIVKKNGEVINARIIPERENAACSFERIYFSRGGDADIYKERKNLGKNLVPAILKRIDYDFKNTVFSFIPNTSEIAFYGMIEEINLQFQQHIFEQANKENWENDRLQKELQSLPRIEKIALKDVKLRTFITEDASRNDMVHHVYDVTYGVVKDDVDTLVIIDDSIVRGTTLKESILTMLNRLKPKKIIVVSSAPQIRFPDCYGIEMARMDSFVAFRAVVEILQERGQEQVIYNIYDRCIEEIKKPDNQIYNCVKDIYNGISADEISQKIADLVKPDHMTRDVELIFQTIEGLHEACPKNKGDWYFTGNYPTPGGNKMALKEFIKYFERIFNNKIEKNN